MNTVTFMHVGGRQQTKTGRSVGNRNMAFPPLEHIDAVYLIGNIAVTYFYAIGFLPSQTVGV